MSEKDEKIEDTVTMILAITKRSIDKVYKDYDNKTKAALAPVVFSHIFNHFEVKGNLENTKEWGNNLLKSFGFGSEDKKDN